MRLFARVAAKATGAPCSKGADARGAAGAPPPIGPAPDRGDRPIDACAHAAPPSAETRPSAVPFGGAQPPGPGPSSGGCPVVAPATSSGGGCPVVGAGVDPANLMPPTPNAAPAGAAAALSTARAPSSIPTAAATNAPAHQAGTGGGDADGVWVYPSPQMFFNAMAKKGWSPSAADMPAVVAIHNAVNERAWAEVVAWEARAGGAVACGGPRLKRFAGRPRDVSPKARLLNLLGYRLPFDRHDWVVDRCGKEVRYVIDFYNAAPAAATSASPPGAPPPVALHLDVRPALDSPGAAWARVKAQAAWVASGRWQGRG